MPGRIEGKIAIVTGAASGIGKAVVQRFLAEGAKVVAVDVNGTQLAAVHPAGEAICLLEQDIRADDAADRIITLAIDQFGGVDIVVNNAGVCDYFSAEETSDAIWDRAISINLTAMFRICRRAIPELRKRGGGRIINTASILADRSYLQLAAYAASKHGVAGLTKTLAIELGWTISRPIILCPERL